MECGQLFHGQKVLGMNEVECTITASMLAEEVQLSKSL